MTRAKANPIRPEEEWGHVSRAKVFQLRPEGWTGPIKYIAYRAEKYRCEAFLTWAEAMDYALGNDTKETKE